MLQLALHLTLDHSVNIHRRRLASMTPTRLANLDVLGKQFPQPRSRPDRRIIDQLRSRAKILPVAPAVKLDNKLINNHAMEKFGPLSRRVHDPRIVPK
jgi:hypothetical protein